MTQEQKQLLFKYLSMALPYGVICYYETSDKSETMLGKLTINILKSFISNNPLISEENQCRVYDYSVVLVKPYLRLMSSMTEKEKEEYKKLQHYLNDTMLTIRLLNNWLNEHHFDYNGLIEKGLAFEAPEEMYNINKK